MVYIETSYPPLHGNEEIGCVVAKIMQKVGKPHLKVSYFATLAEAKAWLKI